MTIKRTQIVALALAGICLSACATIKIPEINVPGIPEFKEAAAELMDGYPEVSQAPVRPKDLRSSREWDMSAKALMSERKNFIVPDDGGMADSAEDVARDIEALKAQVRSYKLDDPQ